MYWDFIINKEMEGGDGVVPELQEQLDTHTDWTRAAIYDSQGKIFASTFDVDKEEIAALLDIWKSEEDAMRSGVVLAGKQFDVHRFYDTLIYGRTTKGGSLKGEGFCIHRTMRDENKKSDAEDEGGTSEKSEKSEKEDKQKRNIIYTIITFGFPTLSSKAIPQVVTLSENYLQSLV